MLVTPFTERFGVDHPVVFSGTEGAGRAEFVAGIANAGALGMLCASIHASPEGLASEVARCRELTDRPFGVNLSCVPSTDHDRHSAYRDVVAAAEISAVEIVGGASEMQIQAFRGAGIQVVERTATVQRARRAQDLGVGAVTLDGFGLADRAEDEDSDWLALIGVTANHLTVPVIVHGGLADGRALTAVLALGASAIEIGNKVLYRSREVIDETSCGEIVACIVDEAEDIITGRLSDLFSVSGSGPRVRRLHAEPASEIRLETALEAAWEGAP